VGEVLADQMGGRLSMGDGRGGSWGKSTLGSEVKKRRSNEVTK
jgi:hypothetical protein